MIDSLLYDALAHHVWATSRVIDACNRLTDEQLHRPVDGTYGPIIDTLRHLVSTDGWYVTFFRDRPNPIPDHSEPNLAELQAANVANGEVWMELVKSDLDGEADMPEAGDGWIFHAPIGFRLAQVVQHGTDHRSQVCTGLTALGMEPPAIDVWAYGEATGRTRSEYLTAM